MTEFHGSTWSLRLKIASFTSLPGGYFCLCDYILAIMVMQNEVVGVALRGGKLPLFLLSLPCSWTTDIVFGALGHANKGTSQGISTSPVVQSGPTAPNGSPHTWDTHTQAAVPLTPLLAGFLLHTLN